jgi:Transmembrane secretion effector
VAHWLRDRGFEAYAVQGGLHALLGTAPLPAPLETLPLAEPRERRRSPLSALHNPRFRVYSLGVLLSLTGSWVEAAAFGFVVLELGASASTLGLIGFLNTIPNLVFALPAGALADRYDRRTLLLIFQTGNMAVAAALAVLWATGELTVPLMGALAVAGGSLGTLSFPAFQGMLASTVPQDDLESAVAINSLSLQVARCVGPAIAGFILASAGPTWVFGVNAFSFLAVLLTLALLPASRARVAEGAARLGSAIGEGLRYVLGQRSMASLIALLAIAGLFATPPVAFMLPAIVRENLDAGAMTLGLLTACLGLGSVLGSIALLWLSGRPNKGEPALVGYFLTALAIAGVGLSTSIPLSFVLGLVGGFCGVIFIGLSTVAVQAMSSDAMRSRAMAIWAAAFVGMLPAGALITAGLTAAFGPGGAVFIDGLATLVGGAIVVALRPEVVWLGCAALPESCLAATSPAAVYEEEHELAAPA